MKNNEDSTIETTKQPVKRLEAFLVYNGAPDPEDDPADYFIYSKGVRLA